MSLQQGTRIGPYEVIGSLGAGGMGEVCRARDTKLGRDVALKVLPDAFATNPERMSRFQREAQLLAALNHPNIAAIYGLEDAGPRSAIVMELVEGHTLACPLPIDDALRVAKQIAEAIEYAHERGIIHRDLKPANIKVTPDGTVKVLDFGLAKAMDEVSDSMASFAGSMSPTLSLGATHAGVIMGTAAYMAPEQAKGRPADRRSDVWAFGIVLYETLTGHPMFGGDSVPETLASVMKDQITIGKLPESTPASIRALVSRCLERDPRRRLQSIGEARIVLEDAISGVPTNDVDPRPAATASRWPWLVAATAMLLFLATIGWMALRPAPRATPPAVQRFMVPPTEGSNITLSGPNAPHLALSPNGRYLTYVADEPGHERTLWVRAMDSLTAQRLDRTEGALFPFWSSDSQHIAFFANGKLMRVAIAGGAPLTICDAVAGEGGTWFQAEGQEGVIVFAPSASSPLQRVNAQGGVPKDVTKLAAGENSHSFPQFLPDGRRFLYLARGDKAGIVVQSLDSSERTPVLATIGRAMYAPPGLLVFLRENTLLAQRWDTDTLRLEGEPVLIAEGIRSGGNNGRNAFVVSENGVLAYRGGGSTQNHVVWYTRDGKPGDDVLPPGEIGSLELSPDESRFVVIRGTGQDRDLWLKDLASGVYSRLTSMAGPETEPVWSPDSRRIAYVATDGNGKEALFETLIGSGKHTVIPRGDTRGVLTDWTRDGMLVLNDRGIINVLPALQADGKPGQGSGKTLVSEKYTIDQIRVSPDGKWAAYMSMESGQPEINVATFPGFTERRQISSGTGVQPVWRADGKELFFFGRDQKLRAVEVSTDPGLMVGPIQTLFQTRVNPSNVVQMYGVTRDGKRFIVREPLNRELGSAEQLFLVTNWTSLVK